MTATLALDGAPRRRGVRPAARSATEPGRAERIAVGASLLLFAGAVMPLATGQGGETGADPLSLAAQAVICLVALARLLRSPGGIVAALERLDPWLLALVVVLVLSTTWSVDPALTVRKVAAVVAVTVFGLYVASRWSLPEQVWLVAQALGVVAVLSAVTVVLLPRYGLQPGTQEWRGVFVQKNVLARLMALGLLAGALCVCSSTASARRRTGATLAALACGVVLLKSGSIFAVGSAGCIAAAVICVLIQRVPFPVRHALVVAGSGVAATGAVAAWLDRSQLLDAVGKDISLTGRVPLWESVLGAVSHRPLQGYGYGAFWQGWQEPSTQVLLHNPWGPPHAHNGVLEMLLGVGLVGTLLWLVLLGTCLAKALRYALTGHSSLAVWPAGLLIIVIVYNVTEVTTTSNSFFWALLVAVSTQLRGVWAIPRVPASPPPRSPRGLATHRT